MKKINVEKKEVKSLIIKELINIILYVVIVNLIILLSFLYETYSLGNSFNHYINVFTINFCVITGIYFILKACFGNQKISLILITIIDVLFEVANYITFCARGSKLAISDIYSFKTAANVFSVEELNIKWKWLALYGVLLLVLFFIKFKKIKPKKKKYIVIQRLSYLAIGIIICIIMYNSNDIKKIPIWNLNDYYADNGTFFTAMKLVQEMNLKPTEGYNEKEVKEILDSYQEDDFENVEEKPNIIVIMNESLTDVYELYGLGNRDSMPFLRQLQDSENTITGTLYSGEFGGSTGNVEYEFLTQNNTTILPKNAVVYNQYILENRNTFVSYTKRLGYDTYAFHPWYNSGYSRAVVYREFGFDHRAFLENIKVEKEDKIGNGFVSDYYAYRKIIEQFENRENDKPIFSFTVTVQNHMSYKKEDNTIDDFAEKEETNVYLEDVYRSDDALRMLVDYFKDYDEKTIIVVFGDHQPSIGDITYDQDNPENYKTPFILWANFDIEEKKNVEISPIYIQNEIVNILNLPKTSYMKYIENLRQKMPVLTKRLYKTSDGEVYLLNNEQSPYYDDVKQYNSIIYYQITHK